jgi:hypothetical protein
VYAALRRERDDADRVAAVPDHSLAETLAAVLRATPAEIARHLGELARLGLVAPAGDAAVVLVPRPRRRAPTPAADQPDARKPDSVKRALRRARANGAPDKGADKPLSGALSGADKGGGQGPGQEGGQPGGHVPCPGGRSDETRGNQGSQVADNTPDNGADKPDTSGVVSPTPPSSLPSEPLKTPDSSPEKTVQSPPAREGEGATPAGDRLTLTPAEHAPKAKGKRSRPKPAPRPDPVPDAGTPARAVYDAIAGDAGLRAIVAGPGDYALRITDPRRFPGVDVLAVVLDAAEYLARGERAYTDGRGFLNNQLRTAATRAAARARPLAVDVHRVSDPRRGQQPAATHAEFARSSAAAVASGTATVAANGLVMHNPWSKKAAQP